MNVRHARVVITGGAGLSGSHIADECVKQGASEVVILDTFSRGRRENLAWAAIDLHQGLSDLVQWQRSQTAQDRRATSLV